MAPRDELIDVADRVLDSTRVRGLLALVLFGAFMGAAATATRALHGRVDAEHLMLVRAVIWLAWLLPWALAHRADAFVRQPWLGVVAVSGVGSLFGYAQALFLIPVPLATTLLYASTPLFVVFLQWAAYAVPPSGRELLLMVGLAFGLGLIALPEGAYSMDSVQPAGVAMAVMCSACIAVYLLALQRARVSSNVANLWYAVLLLLTVGPLASTHAQAWTSGSLALAALYGVFSLIAQALVVHGSQLAGPAVAGASSAMIPVYATLIGWAVLGEGVSALEMLGIAIVVGCATAISLAGAHGGPPPRFRWQSLSEPSA